MHTFLKKGLILPFFAIILTVPLFSALIRPGFFPMQDDLQAFRVEQMVKCLKDFQIPCRWIPDMGYQYGYPQFNFYPPSVFYLGGILNLTGIQIIDAVKILFILGSIASTATMFIFLNAFFNQNQSQEKFKIGSWAAFIGALLYSYVPYKAAEIYVRGSLSEFWTFVFFPLIFWSLLQVIRLGKFKYVSFLAISTGFLLITHNLMSFIFLPIAGIWSISLIIILNKWKMFPKVIIGVILGLGLAAFFTIPVIFEGKFVHLETLKGGYFDYRQHFVDLNQLFLSNHFGYGSSQLGPNDDLSLSVGIIHWTTGLVAILLTIMIFKKDKKLAILVWIMGICELIVLFLMHQKSSLIWDKLSPLSWLQFPWRFLSDSTFILSFLGAIGVFIIGNFKKKLGIIAGLIIIISIFILHVSFFQPKSWFNISDSDKFSGSLWEKQLTISIFDYLPIYAKFPPTQKAPDYPEVLNGKVEFINYKKGSNYQIGEINAVSNSILRLPLFDFPGMEVTIDQKKVNHWHDDCRNEKFCLGLITFDVLQGKHKIEARFKDTNIRIISNIITLGSGILVLGLFF